MAGKCRYCSSELKDGAKFCENCGAAVEENSVYQQYDNSFALPSLGFSSRVNDPEILAAVKKNRKAAKIFSAILVPIPLIGFTVYSFVSDKMETADAVKYGGIVSVIFLIFAIYGFIKGRAENTYEAVVTKKKSKLRHENNNDSGIDSTYTEYIVYAKTDDGKTKKIRETSKSKVWAYNYLNEGDRFKYHPQFNFPYELYDKSKAPYIACVSCGTENDITADRCKKCNLPLLK